MSQPDDLRAGLIALRRELCETGWLYWEIASQTNLGDDMRAQHKYTASAYKDVYHKIGKLLNIARRDEQFTIGWEAGRPIDEPKETPKDDLKSAP